MTGEVRRTERGNWRFIGIRYDAEVDGETGHLTRLSVDGRQVIGPTTGTAGPFRGNSPVSADIVRYEDPTTVGSWDGNTGVWWQFLPDAIGVEYALNYDEGQPTLLRIPYGDVEVAFEAGARLVTRIPVGEEVAPPKCEVGFETDAPCHVFAGDGVLKFRTSVMLDCEARQVVQVAVVIMDYNTQEVLREECQEAVLEPGKAGELICNMEWDDPGVFSGSVRVRRGGVCVGWKDFAFVYDLPAWKPALYRPAEFWEFWEGQLAAMREIPLDAEMTLDEENSSEGYRVYKVEVTGVGGRRIRGTYGEPAAYGIFPVVLHTPHPGKDMGSDASALHVAVAGEMEDVARYRLNVGDRRKSNFLHVYLDFIRWIDFADSRGKSDWSRCLAPAGSRGGPMVIAAAALDPRIKLVTMSVPTCNRWDWQVRHTSGWGPWACDRLPGQSVEDFVSVLSYFDPSHFAERVNVPVAASWGMVDGLSPLNGQLSMWVNLRGPKFLELRPWDGHTVYSEEFAELMRELEAKLMAGEPIDAPLWPALG